MDIFKNKFIVIWALLILSFFTLQIFLITSSFSKHTDSYLVMISWNWSIQRDWERIFLDIDDREKIYSWDSISIIGEDSLWVIEWWDNSVTRLSWNSRLRIDENDISSDLANIKISFELIRWKTWSNVLSIMWDDSYFHQTSKEITASVRWTIYEVDADNEFLRVIDHRVDIKNDQWEIVSAYKWDVVWFRGLIFDELLRVRDELWENINNTLDRDHLNQIREDLNDIIKSWNPIISLFRYIKWLFNFEYRIDTLLIEWKFDNIEKLLINSDPTKKDIILSRLNLYNQKLNFESWDDLYIYNKKLAVRNLLIEYSNDENLSETLTTYAIYDLWNMFSSNSIDPEILKSTLSFLEQHKSSLNIDSDLKRSFWENMDLFNEIFSIWNLDFSLDWFIQNLDNLKRSWLDLLNRWLDSFLNFTNN